MSAALQGAPVNETPVNETPVNETPINEIPVNEVPQRARRSTRCRSTSCPVNETPVNELPVNETPVNETPVNELPVNETPVNETPVNELPVNEIMAAVAPVNETRRSTSCRSTSSRRRTTSSTALELRRLPTATLGEAYAAARDPHRRHVRRPAARYGGPPNAFDGITLGDLNLLHDYGLTIRDLVDSLAHNTFTLGDYFLLVLRSPTAQQGLAWERLNLFGSGLAAFATDGARSPTGRQFDVVPGPGGASGVRRR